MREVGNAATRLELSFESRRATIRNLAVLRSIEDQAREVSNKNQNPMKKKKKTEAKKINNRFLRKAAEKKEGDGIDSEKKGGKSRAPRLKHDDDRALEPEESSPRDVAHYSASAFSYSALPYSFRTKLLHAP